MTGVQTCALPILSAKLMRSIHNLQPDVKTVYGNKRVNYCEGKRIRFGTFGSDRVFRLYNKIYCTWNNATPHEKVTGHDHRIVLKGNMDHYTIRDRKLYENKLELYAHLSANKYHERGKKATWVKRYLSPVYGFIKGYIFQLGFLDGGEGYWLAKIHARHTR